MDKVKKIANPLTIVGMFAGIAESAGATVLLFLPQELQKIFVWFVMLFPVLLVGSFFGILYYKHTVFYAPGDYKNEEIFKELANSLNDIKSMSSELESGVQDDANADTIKATVKEYVRGVTDKVDETKHTIVEPINISTKYTSVYDKVLLILLDGRARTLMEISEETHLSRNAIQQALKRLASDNIIVCERINGGRTATYRTNK